MTFLIASVIMFMLSSSVSDYLDSSDGHSAFQTTLSFTTKDIVKSDTSATNYTVPNEVSIDVDCRDFTPDTKITVDHVFIIPQDTWFLAIKNLDKMSVGILETLAIGGAHDVCVSVLKADRHYRKQQHIQREA